MHRAFYMVFFFFTGTPPKSSKYKKVNLGRLGVSWPIYVNVDSLNLGFPNFNFLGGYHQWEKNTCINLSNSLNLMKLILIKMIKLKMMWLLLKLLNFSWTYQKQQKQSDPKWWCLIAQFSCWFLLYTATTVSACSNCFHSLLLINKQSPGCLIAKSHFCLLQLFQRTLHKCTAKQIYNLMWWCFIAHHNALVAIIRSPRCPRRFLWQERQP